jgi:transposase
MILANRPFPLEQDGTVIAVIEMSQSSWLVGGIVPDLERRPLKKLEPAEDALLRLLQRWRDEAVKAGRTTTRIAVAFEAGRDGFWLARWLRTHGIEAYVIHPTSVAVSREHRRAKTDRLDTELLKRAFLGWLRGEPDHCGMAAIPTLEEQDVRRPHRERETLVGERTRIVNRVKSALARLGIHGFKPTLRRAPDRLDELRMPGGAVLPPNTRAELLRDMARLRFVMRNGHADLDWWDRAGHRYGYGGNRLVASFLACSTSHFWRSSIDGDRVMKQIVRGRMWTARRYLLGRPGLTRSRRASGIGCGTRARWVLSFSNRLPVVLATCGCHGETWKRTGSALGDKARVRPARHMPAQPSVSRSYALRKA